MFNLFGWAAMCSLALGFVWVAHEAAADEAVELQDSIIRVARP